MFIGQTLLDNITTIFIFDVENVVDFRGKTLIFTDLSKRF